MLRKLSGRDRKIDVVLQRALAAERGDVEALHEKLAQVGGAGSQCVKAAAQDVVQAFPAEGARYRIRGRVSRWALVKEVRLGVDKVHERPPSFGALAAVPRFVMFDLVFLPHATPRKETKSDFIAALQREDESAATRAVIRGLNCRYQNLS
jgi:hypothetical protein